MNRMGIKAMNTHALMNVNLMLKLIEDDKIDMLKIHLEAYFTKHNRKYVFSDAEVLTMLSGALADLAGGHHEEITDKIAGALWHQVKPILETHEVL